MEDSFFEMGIKTSEALSAHDFRQSPLLTNCFIHPTSDRLIFAIPVKGHLNVFTIKPPLVEITDRLLSIPKSQGHLFNYELIAPSEFWVSPSLESAEIISKLPYEPFPIFPNVFWHNNAEKGITSFAHIVGQRAYCLNWPSIALRPIWPSGPNS